MDSITSLLRRRETGEDSNAMSGTMIDLLIALLVLVFVGLLLVGGLYIMRRIRRSRAVARQSLPQYNDTEHAPDHRRVTITTSPYGRGSSIYVYDEKSSILSNPSSTPLSPDSVPEIRITFPDEQDEGGRRKSGRVLVVRVGETGVGLEPLKEEEQLPAYQKETGERFQSIDIERIGGLKEKPSYS